MTGGRGTGRKGVGERRSNEKMRKQKNDSGHSCKSQLRITMHSIMKSFDIKKQVDLVSEDEIHYLLHCTCHANHREIFTTYLTKVSKFSKFR
jgi:hypothetical protein